ncbi:Uncharacterised protein [Klebsiella michiganensis]|uniref:Uncharacterized protein n=1 Tax=Klebsiella michiganensis TaxID=1134687 RepID=A0A7H4PDP6_9ENTR|nr:Uncharacterised protein [Klebsiella michiganensis]
MVPLTASRRLICPSMTLLHSGASESSKSAIKTFTFALSALMTILRSTGPVISTRRSCKSSGMPRIVQSPLRMEAVSEIKSGSLPLSIACCCWIRAARSLLRSGVKRRTSSVRNSTASGVKICFSWSPYGWLKASSSVIVACCVMCCSSWLIQLART